ncbi:Antirestriction protein [Thalassolituus maritimus]|uniref:Antirestriction protein n=1 Tax=Thalassolituus maritimus TaxID=484498 RepID=A0A1N7IXZ6_9GAMM|nr:antirestriction protein ArdA [Thalassolituus maritimus]SIS41871.1 Antirestriction protein [Thalassolituus maritimus]
MSEEIRIYVACLAAYSSGYLHGVWIDATKELDDIQEQVSNMLKSSPIEMAEEYAIHDYEGFESVRLSEWEGLERAHNIACFIEEHGTLGAELLNIYDIEEASKVLENNYHGCFSSLADYAEQFTCETSSVPEHLQYYIDYERMGRDWKMSGDIYTIETAHDEVHIFSNH